MMKHKVALKITFLLSAKLLLIEQWFEIAHAYRTTFVDGGVRVPRPKYHHRSNFVTMYFDDVSRYEVQWTPNKNVFKSIAIPAIDTQQTSNSAVQDKLHALHKKFTGYDAEQAASLSPKDIQGETAEWATRSGLVGSTMGDEVYESVKKVYVCNSRTVLECLADFWKTLVTVVEDEKTDESAERTDGTQLVMIIFPNCPELYDYKVMSTVHTAIDFCSGSCLYFGSKFSLTHFHPKYKNAPSMIYPTRHSPFPCFGLHFPGKYDAYVQQLSAKYGSDPKKKKIADAETPFSREWVKERANTFEVLYNKAAASSTADNLGRSAALRNISQRFQKGEVIETTKKWIDAARNMNPLPSSAKGEINKALEFADTVRPDLWHVIYDKTPEECYAAIWRVVSDLERLSNSEQPTSSPNKGKVDVSALRRFNQLQWMYSLGLPVGGKVNDPMSPNVLSAMFITTKFRAYNAEGFKRFAITVNAALKRLTSEKMFLEVFHPEYCGKKGYDNKLRRSPFPMIQICHVSGNNANNSNNAPVL